MKSEESNGCARRESRTGWNFAGNMCRIVKQSVFSLDDQIDRFRRVEQRKLKRVHRTKPRMLRGAPARTRFKSQWKGLSDNDAVHRGLSQAKLSGNNAQRYYLLHATGELSRESF